MKDMIAKLVAFQDLSHQEMTGVAEKICQGQLTEGQIAALLLGLKMKGESKDELTALAQVMQEKSLSIPVEMPGAMDNCGTGGDQSYSFNVSTTVAFVLAGGGIPMAKHGNRSISSKSGSADVLEALGIAIDQSPEKLARVFKEAGIVFLFAKNLHPAMKEIMPARLALGVPTIMNLIGPLINPIPLETQLMGTSRSDLLEVTAQALQEMGRKRAIVVTGPNGMDEAGLDGINQIAIVTPQAVSYQEFEAKDYGLTSYPLEAIRGGDAKENAAILKAVLQNQAGPYLEMTVLNAGLGFFANGRAANLAEGIALAREVIASGKAMEKLKALQEAQYD